MQKELTTDHTDKHGSRPWHIDYSASVLFVKKADSFEATRADFQRVKPYSERFGVKIGPLRALPF